MNIVNEVMDYMKPLLDLGSIYEMSVRREVDAVLVRIEVDDYVVELMFSMRDLEQKYWMEETLLNARNDLTEYIKSKRNAHRKPRWAGRHG